jgi:hypothetical protein
MQIVITNCFRKLTIFWSESLGLFQVSIFPLSIAIPLEKSGISIAIGAIEVATFSLGLVWDLKKEGTQFHIDLPTQTEF